MRRRRNNRASRHRKRYKHKPAGNTKQTKRPFGNERPGAAARVRNRSRRRISGRTWKVGRIVGCQRNTKKDAKRKQRNAQQIKPQTALFRHDVALDVVASSLPPVSDGKANRGRVHAQRSSVLSIVPNFALPPLGSRLGTRSHMLFRHPLATGTNSAFAERRLWLIRTLGKPGNLCNADRINPAK